MSTDLFWQLPAGVLAVGAVGYWFIDKWLLAWIDQRARLGAQKALEAYKAELETARERFNQLQDHLLNERAARNAMLDQRTPHEARS